MSNRSQVYQDDLRRTCEHEAGHAVVALCLCAGATVNVRVYPTASEDSVRKKLVTGSCCFTRPAKTRSADLAAVAVAGLVAEHRDMPVDDLMDLMEMDQNVLSASDRVLAGKMTPAALRRALHRAQGVLLRHARELEALSVRLYEEALAAPDGWAWADLRHGRGRIIEAAARARSL